MWADLACPVDYGSLEAADQWLVCRTCGRGYPVIDDIPTFLPADEDPRWRMAQKRRAAQLPPVFDEEAGQTIRLSTRARVIHERMSQYVDLGPLGRSLQVGLPGDELLQQITTGVRYGVEPLAGVLAQRNRLPWGHVRWIAGRGEELPFANERFGLVVLDGVLDSAESPQQMLQEAQRCLADDGAIWLGTRVCSNPRLAALMPAESSVLWHFTVDQLDRLCQSAGLSAIWTADEDEYPSATSRRPTTLSVADVRSRAMILRRATRRQTISLWAPAA